MNKFILPAIVTFSLIIIVEIVILFSRPSFNKNMPPTQTEQINPTKIIDEKIEYQPVRNYSGRVISFGPATNGYVFDLTYTNMDNLKGSLFFNQEETNTAIVQYINNEEIIEEKTGLEIDTLQPQDRFDIIITDTEDDILQTPNELKVDRIVFKIYK